MRIDSRFAEGKLSKRIVRHVRRPMVNRALRRRRNIFIGERAIEMERRAAERRAFEPITSFDLNGIDDHRLLAAVDFQERTRGRSRQLERILQDVRLRCDSLRHVEEKSRLLETQRFLVFGHA